MWEPTLDILKEVSLRKAASGFPGRVVGFAAESQNLLENAAQKLQKKALDMVVANDINSTQTGFEADQNKVFFLLPGGSIESFPILSKSEVGEIFD